MGLRVSTESKSIVCSSIMFVKSTIPVPNVFIHMHFLERVKRSMRITPGVATRKACRDGCNSIRHVLFVQFLRCQDKFHHYYGNPVENALPFRMRGPTLFSRRTVSEIYILCWPLGANFWHISWSSTRLRDEQAVV